MTKKLEQLSIFIENRAGELCSITSLLEKERVSLLSIMLSDSSEFGILRILTKDIKRAKDLLIKAGFMAQSSFVLAVRIEDHVGSFHKVVKTLNQASIEVRYTYTVNEKNDGIFVFKIDENELDAAAKTLEKEGISVVGAEDL